MTPIPPTAVIEALAALGIEIAEVESWREEGHTMIVLTQDGAKHRLVLAESIKENPHG